MKDIEDFIKVVNDCFAIKFDGETETHYRFMIKGNINGEFKERISTIDKSVFDQMLIDRKI